MEDTSIAGRFGPGCCVWFLNYLEVYLGPLSMDTVLAQIRREGVLEFNEVFLDVTRNWSSNLLSLL